VLLLLFLDNLQARRIKSETLKENTSEMTEIAHRVNELQIRAMQQENTHLQNLLAVRRSQIIDDAEKISEHQHFIAEVYNYIGKIEASPENERNAMLRDLRTKLRLRMNHSEGLEKFYAKTETLHKDFNARLIDKYPQLTPQERRLATLLRLGFSTKYMASLLGISESSVEVGRHRMRKKLGLARKDKLTYFIKNI
jgi:DNA-binding CsgD family transcriptional regulator